MSQLIALADRIKVITNIQKTAHAMQLISMSTLSRINAKKKALQTYTQQINETMLELGTRPAIIAPEESRIAYLIIGSQKGFCGNFNSTLFNYVKEVHKQATKQMHAIAIGPYAYDFCKKMDIELLTDKITFSLHTLSKKSEEIVALLQGLHREYDAVMVLSNYNASIFLQKPQKTSLTIKKLTADVRINKEYTTEQPAHEIAEYLMQLYLKHEVTQLLLESLRAENAARALAMDSSTRNADNLLTDMKLVYNKLRQAKVTKELTELSSAL